MQSYIFMFLYKDEFFHKYLHSNRNHGQIYSANDFQNCIFVVILNSSSYGFHLHTQNPSNHTHTHTHTNPYTPALIFSCEFFVIVTIFTYMNISYKSSLYIYIFALICVTTAHLTHLHS